MGWVIDQSTGQRYYQPDNFGAQQLPARSPSTVSSGQYIKPGSEDQTWLEDMLRENFGRLDNLPQDDPMVQYANQRGYFNLNPSSNPLKQGTQTLQNRTLQSALDSMDGGGAGGDGSSKLAPLPARTDTSALSAATNWRPRDLKPVGVLRPQKDFSYRSNLSAPAATPIRALMAPQALPVPGEAGSATGGSVQSGASSRTRLSPDLLAEFRRRASATR